MKGEKKHAPAWCDRIICFREGLKQQEFSRGESSYCQTTIDLFAQSSLQNPMSQVIPGVWEAPLQAVFISYKIFSRVL
jgi:hypothetical protein